MPKTTPGGVLSAAQRQQLANMVPAVTRALSVGNYEEVEQNGLLTQLRRRTSAEPTPGDKASQGWLGTLNCSPWGARSDVDMYKAVVVGTPSLRVLRGEGTTLSVLSLDCALTVQDAHGERKIQLEKPYAIAQGDDGTFKERLQRRFVVSLLVSTPDHGKPAVLAGSDSYAVPAGR
ncbi:hypothetical protein [Luteipulveratus flavus]|uniref:Uncharacterized protein n=1 Tax=Luteipulveratus flavus TaxID=3031728 RepID=A0ABT6CFK2_9MICO|nr:hypothetical protein [Luteipulveratus sp. YIM 133296]MDF8266066.1 hypothetical protein [Luteipulveratus sp. YIM 133296]